MQTSVVLQIVGTVVVSLTALFVAWQAKATSRAATEQAKARKATLRPVIELRNEPQTRLFIGRDGPEKPITFKGPMTAEGEDHLRSHGVDLDQPPARTSDWSLILVNVTRSAVAMNVAAWVRDADGKLFDVSNPETAHMIEAGQSHFRAHLDSAAGEALIRYQSIEGTRYYTIVRPDGRRETGEGEGRSLRPDENPPPWGAG